MTPYSSGGRSVFTVGHAQSSSLVRAAAAPCVSPSRLLLAAFAAGPYDGGYFF